VNTCDVPSQIRRKAENVSKIGQLQNTTLVYGVEEMEEDLCVADYGVAQDSTIRMCAATNGGADKKWADVDAGNYFRTVNKIKVDYGAGGYALPHVAGSNDEVETESVLKTAAELLSRVKSKAHLSATTSLDVSDAELESQADSELEATRRQNRTYSMIQMIQAVQLEKQRSTNQPKRASEPALMYLDDGVDRDDIDYKYTACLLKCCPCLAPANHESEPALPQPRRSVHTPYGVVSEADGSLRPRSDRDHRESAVC